jgi:hypothetical protein
LRWRRRERWWGGGGGGEGGRRRNGRKDARYTNTDGIGESSEEL